MGSFCVDLASSLPIQELIRGHPVDSIIILGMTNNFISSSHPIPSIPVFLSGGSLPHRRLNRRSDRRQSATRGGHRSGCCLLTVKDRYLGFDNSKEISSLNIFFCIIIVDLYIIVNSPKCCSYKHL